MESESRKYLPTNEKVGDPERRINKKSRSHNFFLSPFRFHLCSFHFSRLKGLADEQRGGREGVGKERERDLDGNLSNVRLCRTSLDDVAFFLAPLRRVSLPSENVPCYGFLPISHFPLLSLSLSLCISLSFFFIRACQQWKLEQSSLSPLMR